MNKQQQAYGHGDVAAGYCCFHPREVVVGVCAHCLKDRLILLLAANNSNNRSRSSSISLPKVLALGSSFLQRLDSRHHQPQPQGRATDHYSVSVSDDDATASVASVDDDSFISIKFEDNGKATWDSQSQHTSVAEEKPEAARSWSSSTVVVAAAEHVKRGGVTRWRKQVVGRLLQLARWRRSSASAKAVAGGLDGNKSKARGGRGGWIRSLTRRRAHGDRAW